MTDGVLPNPSTNLQVTAGTGMNVTIQAGFGIVRGCMKLEETDRTLSVQAAEDQDRIDTVVLRLDDNDNVRTCDFYVRKGTKATSPTRPQLERTSSIWELGLADLYISKNTTTIPTARITDTRMESARCGIISAIAEFDTTTIYEQIQADLASFKEEEQADFIEWFSYIRDQLSTDVAARLQAQIGALPLLNTTNKDDLVAAINEANQKASQRVTSYNDLTDKPNLMDDIEEWTSGKSYKVGNQVKRNNAVYSCKTANSNTAPPNATYWKVVNLGNFGGLRFGIDGDGNYGYYKADDSFVPFSNIKKFGYYTIGEGDTPNYAEALAKYKSNGVILSDCNGQNVNNNKWLTLCFPIKMDGKSSITIKHWKYIDVKGTFYGKFSDEPLKSLSEITTNPSFRRTLNLASSGSTSSYQSYTESFGSMTGIKWLNLAFVGSTSYDQIIIDKFQ